MNDKDKEKVSKMIQANCTTCGLANAIGEMHENIKTMQTSIGKFNKIYPRLKADIKLKEAYSLVGSDMKMKGNKIKFWGTIISVAISIVTSIFILKTLLFK